MKAKQHFLCIAIPLPFVQIRGHIFKIFTTGVFN